MSNNKKIKFAKTNKIVSDVFFPKPSSHFLPEWYKKMESFFPEDKPLTIDSITTIKKCIPVFDSLTAGYTIVLWSDVSIVIEDGEPRYKSPFVEAVAENSHPMKQAYRHPMANSFKFPKFLNPWAIQTPSGYSCLFLPPLNNSNEWFEILPGIVDTDTYNAPVNFPFVLKDPKKEVIIPAGTPIAQVIPFKRDEWEMEVLDENSILFKKSQSIFFELRSKIFNSYKTKYWHKKSYK